MKSKAPGKSHRDGISLTAIMEMFPDDAAAERWFAEIRWPDGVHCPHCGSDNVQTRAKGKMPYRCRERGCRKRFSVKTGTVMQSSNLGYRVWALAVYLSTTSLKGVASMKLHRDLEVTQKTAWHLAHRIRKAWEAGGGLFSGPVEIDESYFGGKKSNKHASRKLNAGRGMVGKTAVAGARDRDTGMVRAKVIPSASKPVLQEFIDEAVAPAATIYTDEAAIYKGMDRPHESVGHSVGEYVRERAHTNGIESFWSLLKRGHKGTFHKISPKHLDRYVTEFAGRHNDRDLGTAEQMRCIVRRMDGRSLRYGDLAADNGLESGARK